MSPKKSVAQKQSFAAQFEELEKIVTALEADDVDVEESIKQFEEGLKIAAALKKSLEKTEQTIEQLKKKYE